MATVADIERYVEDLAAAISNVKDELGYVERAISEGIEDAEGDHEECASGEAYHDYMSILQDLADCDPEAAEELDTDLGECIRRARQRLRAWGDER